MAVFMVLAQQKAATRKNGVHQPTVHQVEGSAGFAVVQRQWPHTLGPLGFPKQQLLPHPLGRSTKPLVHRQWTIFLGVAAAQIQQPLQSVVSHVDAKATVHQQRSAEGGPAVPFQYR